MTKEPKKTATPDHTPGTVTDADKTADVSTADLADAANSPPNQMTEEVHITERAATVQEQGIGPRDPYPVGNPPDPTEPNTDNPQQYGAQPVKDDDVPANPEETK